VLLAHKADLADRDSAGRTVLHYLASNESFLNPEALDYILSQGADINVLDANGRTPIYMAVGGGRADALAPGRGFYGSADIVRQLIAKGAKVNVQDKQGRTLVHHFAAYNLGNGEVLTALVEAGVSGAEKDKEGNTAYDLAKKRDYFPPDVVERLRQLRGDSGGQVK